MKNTCYNKNYQQMRLFVLCLYFLFLVFPYMFRAFISPSSGVFQAVVFMLPFGSCSALLIVCVRQRTGWWWAHESPKHVGKRRGKGNKDIVQKVASVGNSYCNTYRRCTEWKPKTYAGFKGINYLLCLRTWTYVLTLAKQVLVFVNQGYM